jgi:hypothetical protein
MRQLILLGCVMTTIGITGCGSDAFPTEKTRGTVTCEGEPVGNVFVFFEPLKDGESAIVGKQGIGRADENGVFEVSTYGENDGAVVGKHRVRVAWMDGKADPSCPCLVDSETDVMEVEIKEGEVNEFEVALPKQTRRRQMSLDEMEALDEADDED